MYIDVLWTSNNSSVEREPYCLRREEMRERTRGKLYEEEIGRHKMLCKMWR
jgi:hypothetical protein